ncbi:zinc-dependent alcohol dehydrogenase family protein [Bacillus infantis]|uniref:zinc-dependent alcohol dehydrogenase family protein n=1 Tax=Bacillus infantis TaxID=324767 RepID=UPI003CF0BE90
MLAAYYNGSTKLHLQQVPLKELKSDEVLIKIDSATICGTDLHILEGKFESKPPVVLGHEFSGYVEKYGEEVNGLKVGDLVTVEPHIYCGLCKYCRIGKPHLCLDRKAWGINMDGGFSQYAVVRHDTVYKVPSFISPEEAALAENVGCCMNGINRVDIKLGDTVVIIGGGAAGIILAQLARLSGAAKIIVSEPSEYRRRFMENRDIDIIVDPINESLEELVMNETEDLGADVVIDSAGKKETAKQCFDLAGRGARILFFGVVPPMELIQIEPNLIFRNELTVLGSIRNPFSHHQVVEIMPKLMLKELITHSIPLKNIDEAIHLAKKGAGLKVCIKPNE